jgi:hypothetical protein
MHVLAIDARVSAITADKCELTSGNEDTARFDLDVKIGDATLVLTNA